jgi:uncharacterized membrane protein YkvA (DUF1232 family)
MKMKNKAAVVDYSEKYSEDSLWKKIGKYALAAGRSTIEKALVLYYCLQDADTPKWAKTIIIGALGYFIMPLDAIPDFMPAVGFADDLGALVAAAATVMKFIKPKHEQQAKEKLAGFFGGNEQ